MQMQWLIAPCNFTVISYLFFAFFLLKCVVPMKEVVSSSLERKVLVLDEVQQTLRQSSVMHVLTIQPDQADRTSHMKIK